MKYKRKYKAMRRSVRLIEKRQQSTAVLYMYFIKEESEQNLLPHSHILDHVNTNQLNNICQIKSRT